MTLYDAASRIIANWRLAEPQWVSIRWNDLLALMEATVEAERPQCQCGSTLVYVGVGYICGACSQLVRIEDAGSNVIAVADTQEEWEARKQSQKRRAE